MKKLKRIGRRDKADFPEFDLEDIDVKVDTGAYNSVIHCQNIKETTEGLQFQLLGPKYPEYDRKMIIAEKFFIKDVKSSNGQIESRYYIDTEIILFGKRMPITVSLANRSDMKTPILLGRTLLRKRFLVDVSRKNLSFKKKAKSCK